MFSRASFHPCRLMSGELEERRHVTDVAMIVEGGLAVLALAVGWLVRVPPLASVRFTVDALPDHAAAVLWGVAATVPMLLGMWLLDRFPVGPLARLKQVVDEMVAPMFAEVTIAELAMISLMAGIGEEMLFRGLVQTGIAMVIDSPWGVWIAVASAAVLFGLAHAITGTYIVLAALVGAYLGWLLIVTGNLLAPIVAHGLYDFLALVYLAKWRARKKIGGPTQEDRTADW